MSELDARRDLVLQWLEKADDDLWAATALLDHKPPLYSIICFHAQQCAEKMLKAYLQYKDFRFSKTHDLVQLRQWCEEYDPSFEELKAPCSILVVYAVDPRYPGMIVKDRALSEQAGEACKTISGFVMQRLGEFVGSETHPASDGDVAAPSTGTSTPDCDDT